MATIYEVSALAGVSLSSVSRVLNNHEHVSEKTKQKVMAAMDELGYRPNSVARSLASNRSNSIGVLVSELHGPFYGEMLSSIEIELRKAGKHAVVTAGHSVEQSEKDGINFLIDRNCDAIIILIDSLSDEFVIELSKGSTPVVILNRLIPEIKDKCFYIDNELGGYLATKYIIEQGHKNLAYISGPLFKQDANERLDGHKRALNEANLKFDDELFYEGDFLTTSGRVGIDHLLKKNKPFTAAICANDEMASGAMKGLRDHNMLIPKDCSVIGFDNVYFANYLHPELTTMNYPINEMAKMSAQWILKNVYKHSDVFVNNKFTPELIIRESIKKVE
ncbi:MULTISPECIES: LacI family DNA-binding transcriptional regulator [Thalassotalea]|uniref:LacI family DNA-binding transcriptional regulator n=1 Tax=Thalassotalea castellviae TaxID=3075612 RepID=A0ABU3A0D8_9GAMM|nr:LacI family DNA-binding transcriptional regulator [Thalassotalea sp. W431]MDT0603333.1 LacI family DNA-binding transcriptional regulator [Thalassotalea sp. W431]